MNHNYAYFVICQKKENKYYYFVKKFFYCDNIALIAKTLNYEIVLLRATKKDAEETAAYYEKRAIETNRTSRLGG